MTASSSTAFPSAPEQPPAKPWWFHSSALALDDPLAALPKAPLEEGTWKVFCERDCLALEEEWDKLPERIKRRQEGFIEEGETIDETEAKEEEERVEDVSVDERKVIVGVEGLHHVDLNTFKYD
jgi:hypothetical protein